jgi:hypothetical protein
LGLVFKLLAQAFAVLGAYLVKLGLGLGIYKTRKNVMPVGLAQNLEPVGLGLLVYQP